MGAGKFFAKLFAPTSAGAVKGVFEGIGTLAKDIRSAVTGEMSPEKQAELQNKLLELENMSREGQVSINLAEAQNTSVFVSGWRPAIGWVCAISLGFYFIPQYAVATYLWVKMCLAAKALVAYPAAVDGLLELVTAMLGIATLRTIEKSNGTAKH